MDNEEITTTENDIEEADIASESFGERVLFAVLGFFGFIGRTTLDFFKQLPNKIKNKFNEKIAEKRRMPKRKSIHKVYVLVGYTTKEYVDRKYRKERTLLLIRKVLVALIIIVLLIMAYRWIMPMMDTDEYKQMIGINEFNELTESDPFATESSAKAVALESVAITPIPSDTTTPSDTSANE